eukprot:gene40600-16095_t
MSKALLCAAAGAGAAEGKWMEWADGAATRHGSWGDSTCGLGMTTNGVDGMPDWMKPEQQTGGVAWKDRAGAPAQNADEHAYMVAALNPRLFYDQT